MRPLLLFLLAWGFLFCKEPIQGTLNNGLHYYLWEDPSSEFFEVRLALKTPKQAIGIPFSGQMVFGRTLPWEVSQSILTCSDYYTSWGLFTRSDSCARELLHLLKKNLQDFDLSKETLDELKEEVFCTRDLDLKAEAFLSELGVAPSELLFSQEDEKIAEGYRTLLDPSRMALIVTGPLDGLDIEKSIQDLFESLPSQKENVAAQEFKERAFRVLTLNPEELEGEVSLFLFPLKPGLKSYIMSDLLTYREEEDSEVFFDAALHGAHLTFREGTDLFVPHFEEREFQEMKEGLKENYLTHDAFDDWISKGEKCALYFVSELPEPFQLEKVIRTLDTVELKEINDFIDELTKSASSSL